MDLSLVPLLPLQSKAGSAWAVSYLSLASCPPPVPLCPSSLRKSPVDEDVLSGFRAAPKVLLEHGGLFIASSPLP